uniref:C-type lectin domain-containing protein n=1 Tax=Oryzias melastigma TaxID=30732 RepID=A0A3B3DM01_ORYME
PLTLFCLFSLTLRDSNLSLGLQNILLFENPLLSYFYILSGSNVTFVHIDTFMTWPEAQKYCREHYTDLASVRSSAENQKIMDLKPAEEDVWIGLSKTSWTWSNGSTTTFYYWNDGEPNDQTAVCAMIMSYLLLQHSTYRPFLHQPLVGIFEPQSVHSPFCFFLRFFLF